MKTNLTNLEKLVLPVLFESSKGNGHDFGFTNDAEKLFVGKPRQLAGVISSLVKKRIIGQIDTVTTDSGTWTQFVFRDVDAVKAMLEQKS